MPVKSKISLLLMSCLLPSAAMAFKIDTHVWIGQQVINDLQDDRKLSFELDGRKIDIAVPTNVVDAILNNQGAYRAGNIGPDAAPDVLAGQVAVHPGIETKDGTNIGWQTDRFLLHLMDHAKASGRPENLAYTYGFLGHAAADVFAHTYVNQYAGDIFNLFDGETLVEQRHFILEAFIGKHTPPLQDHLGQDLPGGVTAAVSMSQPLASFIKDALVFDDDIQAEYQKLDAVKHLAAYYDFYKSINDIAEDNIWREMDIFITKMVAAFYDVQLTDEQAGEIADLGNKLKDAIREEAVDAIQEYEAKYFEHAKEFEQMGFDNVKAAMQRANDDLNKLFEKRKELDDWLGNMQKRLGDSACGVLEDSLKHLGETLQTAHDIADPIGILDPLGLKGDLFNAISNGNFLDPLGLFGSSEPKVWTFVGTWQEYREAWARKMARAHRFHKPAYLFQTSHWLGIFDELHRNTIPPEGVITITDYDDSYHSVTSSNGVGVLCRDINSSFARLHELNSRLAGELEEEIAKQSQDTIDSIDKLHTEMITTVESFRAIGEALVDTWQGLGQNVNPIQSYLLTWRDSIDTAMTQYIIAANTTMLNTLDPALQGRFWAPLTEWFDCYHASIIGMDPGAAGCKISNSFTSIKASLNESLKALDVIGVPGGMPGLFELKGLVDEEMDRQISKLKDKIADEIVEAILPPELQEIIELLGTDVTPAVLDQYFTKAEPEPAQKGLIKVPNMSIRVQREMGMGSFNGTFFPSRFHVVYNAITMAKLALLDVDGLIALAEAAGANDHLNYLLTFENLIAQAFLSIDGNHQWMPLSPPLPNSRDQYPTALKTYSSHSEGGDGFLLWNGDMRNKIFRKLFRGPVSPGIDAPDLVGMSRFVGNNYPYRVCASNPFPDDTSDRTCGGQSSSSGSTSSSSTSSSGGQSSGSQSSTVRMCTWQYTYSTNQGGGGGVWGPKVDGVSCSSSNVGAVRTKMDGGANYRFTCTATTASASQAQQMGSQFAPCN